MADNELLKAHIESLLFISSKALSVDDIRKALGMKKEDSEMIQAQIDILAQEYTGDKRGIHLLSVEQKNKKKYQLTTNGNFSDIIKKFTKQEITGELTKPSLETLTIVAYKGPITKPELEHIRGVNCSMILRNLMIRGLVSESVDKHTGDMYYAVTEDFVKWLGLQSASDLPEYAELNAYELSVEDEVNVTS